MRPTLRQLQYLVAVADTGKFGEAAKRMHVSQPSLSAQMADMEASLGAILVERGRNGASLTPIGAELVARARLILRDVEDLKVMARQDDTALAGTVRLGVLPTIGPYLLPAAAKRLHELFPELRLSVSEMRTEALANGLRDGQFDTIISTAEDHPGMEAFPLFHEDFWVCAAADDPLSQGVAPVHMRDLKDRALLTLGTGQRFSFIVEEIAHEAGARISAEYEGTSLDAIRQMAMMGAGVAVLPTLYAFSEALRDPDLKVRKINHRLARRNINLFWRPTSPLGNKLQTLGQTLADIAAGIIGKMA